ncbi:MAG: PadR family transcriptional regulator [Clostridia bacterium]|nr:PadR family transcriptional regulator [Clostridia bacterium]
MNSKSKTKYVVLGLLSEGPMSGYEMKKIISIRFSNFWSESFGQIYPELKKLEEAGYISKTTTDSNRTRNVYSITDKGLKLLKEWLGQPAEKEIVRYEILLKLYFGNLEDPKKLLEHISTFRSNSLSALKRLGGFENELTAKRDMHENHPYILMTLLFGQKVYNAYIEWADEVMKLLADKEKK